MNPGTPETLGVHNRTVILDFVRKHGPVSRAELSRKLDISFPSVSSNVKKLLESNYLKIAGSGDNKVGRKATLLEFNATWGYIIGSDIGRSQIRVMLSDLEGKELIYLKHDYNALDGENIVEERLLELALTAVKEAGVKPEQIKYFSLGMPGIMDPNTGKLILVPFMSSIDIDGIVKCIKSIFDAPVVVENSVNLGAIGEKWKGVAKGHRDILYLSYGVGIGSALILSGELYRGVNNAAGEVGYMVPGKSNLRSEFDEQGVLEMLVSGSTIQKDMTKIGIGQDFRSLIDGNRNKMPAVQEIIERIASHIGIMLVNAVSVINVELIVIGGRLGDLIGPYLAPYWKNLLSNHVPFPPNILISSLQEKASVLGGIAIGMRHVSDSLVAQIA